MKTFKTIGKIIISIIFSPLLIIFGIAMGISDVCTLFVELWSIDK